ncbi:unnamed protein product [Malus baccata var. baccata]
MIETDGVVHEFLAGDKKHPRIKEIDATLDEIAKRLKKEGYAANTDEVSSDIDEGEKETALSRHTVNKELSWFVFPLGEMVSSGKKDFRGSSFVMFFDCDDRSFAHF